MSKISFDPDNPDIPASHKKALRAILGQYFLHSGRSDLKRERNIYQGIAHAIYLGDGSNDTKSIVKYARSNSTEKYYPFIEWIIDGENITSFIVPALRHVFDEEYLQQTIIANVHDLVPEIQDHMNHIDDNSSHMTRATSAKATIPQPFNLTQPKPRPKTSSSITEEPQPVIQSKPVPKSTYSSPKELQILETARKMNRLQAQETLKKQEDSLFSCVPASDYQMMKMKKREEAKIASQQATLKSLKPTPKAKKTPRKMLSQGPEIKLNTAAILREEALRKAEEEADMKRLKALEAGELDDISRLSQQLKDKEEQDRLYQEEIERRVLEAQIAREEAIAAKHELVLQKQEEADLERQAKDQLRQVMEEKYEKQQIEKKRRAKLAAQQLKEGTLQAKQRVIEERTKQSLALREEAKVLEEQARIEKEQEAARKKEIISQVRALMENAKNRPQIEFDDTTTANVGVLEEMSLAELKMRLDMMKDARDEEIRQRREQIFQAKVDKDLQLKQAVESLEQHRIERSAKRQMQKMQSSRSRRSGPSSSKANSDLRKKLEMKRSKARALASKTQSRTSSSMVQHR